MIRKKIFTILIWLAILIFLGYIYSKLELEPMQNRKYHKFKSKSIRKIIPKSLYFSIHHNLATPHPVDFK